MTNSIKLGNTTLTGYPAEDLARIQANIDAGVPYPLVLNIERSITMLMLTEEQKAAVQAEPDDTRKRELVQQYVDRLIEKEDA